MLGGVCIVVAVVATVLGAVALWGWAIRFVDFPEVVAGDGTVRLDRPGDKIVYVVTPAAVSAERPSVPVRVTGPDGVELAVSRYAASRTTSRDGRVATAIATFHTSRAGTHTVRLDGGVGEEPVLAVGPGEKFPLGPVALAMLTTGLATGIGLGLIVITAVRRHRTRPGPSGAPMTGHGGSAPMSTTDPLPPPGSVPPWPPPPPRTDGGRPF